MIESGELDYTKPHMILGEGPGRDLVIQNGKYYTSWGKQVSPNRQSLEENGIRWTREVELEIRKRNLQAKADEERKKLEEAIKRIEREEAERIKAGLPVSLTEYGDEDTLEEALDLQGLEELEQEIDKSPVKVKPRK